MFTVPLALIAVQGVKKEKLSQVISLFSFTRLMFVGFGVSLGVTLWIHRMAFYQTRITSSTWVNNPLFINLLSFFKPFTTSPIENLGLTYETLLTRVSTLSLADIYYLFAWIFLGLCLLVFFYQPPKNQLS